MLNTSIRENLTRPEQKSEFDVDVQKSHVVSLFALVGMSISGAMAAVAIFNNNTLLAATLFLASFVFFSGYFIQKKFNNLVISSAITLYSLYVLMFYLVFSGGVENTGPLWVFIVAPVTVFIHGLKRGLIDIALFVIIISAIMFNPSGLPGHATYQTEFKLRLIYAFLTVTFLSALYEYLRGKAYQKMLEIGEMYQQLAHLDPLTQLPNRRFSRNILEQEKVRFERNKEPFAIILCDVDHFKKINDQYGHNVGDHVLVELAKSFTNQLRKQDCISRWGGEEFLFILPQTTAKNANIIAEKIRLNIQQKSIIYDAKSIAVTISMGIAQFTQELTLDEMINQADKRLYEAKSAGRNKVC